VYAFEFDKQKIENAKQINLKNTKFVHTDVNNIEYLDLSFKETNVMFDIIIDDSTHIIEHYNNIINTVSKYLNPGGLLIIENIGRNQELKSYIIDTELWDFHTFIICHHENRNCYNNDKILYLIKK